MLEAIDLECERGGKKLFRALGLSLGRGELLRIAGANGSGKTSLLRILCGLLAPSAGEVRWQGQPIASLREEFSRHLVYLGHAPAVKDELTAAENLSIACALAGRPVPGARVEEALARMGVPLERQVRRMSAGQRRRAALARLLVAEESALWLLDEPFAALDVQAARTLEELIAAHTAAGASVVLTTHQETGIAPTRVIEL